MRRQRTKGDDATRSAGTKSATERPTHPKNELIQGGPQKNPPEHLTFVSRGPQKNPPEFWGFFLWTPGKSGPKKLEAVKGVHKKTPQKTPRLIWSEERTEFWVFFCGPPETVVREKVEAVTGVHKTPPQNFGGFFCGP